LGNGKINGPWDGPKVFDPVAWREWYQRKVFDKVLEAHNILIKEGAYGVVYAWDWKRGIDLIAAGFKDLSPSQLQTMLDLGAAKIQEAQPQLPTEILQRWDQASSLINMITVAEFESLFDALSQAIEQGQFDKEYSRLLSQGLERLQNALLIMMNSQDVQKAEDLLYNAAKVWIRPAQIEATEAWTGLAQISPEVGEEIKKRMLDVRRRLMSNFVFLQTIIGLIPGLSDTLQVLGVPDLFGLIDLLIQNWNLAVRVFHIAEFLDRELLKFSIALHMIISSLAPYFDFFIPTPGNILRAIDLAFYVADLARFLDWMTSPYIQDRRVRDRLEQGFGTIVIAGNSVSQGWEYRGLRLDQGGSYTQQGFGDWWGAILLLPKEKNPTGRSIVAVSRGEHCVNCGAKADEISNWIARAVELVPSVQRDIEADIGIVTFTFTNLDADVGSVLQRLRQEHQNSQIPIIIAWIENGQVRYECIGQGCSNLSWQEQERIACNQLGLPTGCAGPPESQTSDTGSGSNADLITVGSPPPPDPSGSCPSMPFCII
ncbi:MAG: hypothetical protein ACUVQU_04035, partial [Candidatus Bipolaricaulia bacterium]